MDVRLIIQVLVNLIDNAVKYTPAGSTIYIHAVKKSAEAQISVTDNGPGIPDPIKPHIFEMFYTGKNTIAILLLKHIMENLILLTMYHMAVFLLLHYH